MSRCAFSITLTASATLIIGALYVPVIMIDLYTASTASEISSVDPDVIFRLVVSLLFLSPGLMRLGEYPEKKPTLKRNSEIYSRIGAQNASVTQRCTDDSKTTMSPFFTNFLMDSLAFLGGVRLGLLYLSTGVGTISI